MLRRIAVPLLVIGVVLIGFAPIASTAALVTAQDEGADCPATTPEQNKDLVIRYWSDVWTADGDANVAEVLAEDEIHHWGVGNDTTGIDAFVLRLNTFLVAFPDITFEVNEVVAEGDLVVSRWTATATQQGEWQGVAATGQSVTWTGINVFRIECGKIAESWGEADHLGLLRQIGAVPPAATPTP